MIIKKRKKNNKYDYIQITDKPRSRFFRKIFT
jgi:hypothetical protein